MSNQPAVVGPDGVARPYIGGQALIEGVMMRSPHAYAAVVRRRNGELVVREAPMEDLRKGRWSWPLLRGMAALFEALKLGSRTLRFSAEIYERDLEEEAAAKNADSAASPKKAAAPSLLSLLALPIISLVTSEPGEQQGTSGDSKGGGARSLMTALSVAFAIGLFIVLPQAFAAGTSAVLDLELDVRSFGFQVLTGCAKVVILVGYMLLIRRMPEIYRVFQYHGAEHKSIYTYEAGEALTVENARKKTTLHPRCGTTFIVMVALVSVAFFTVIAPFLPQTGLSKLSENVLLILLKLPFFPLITAVTFELQRLLARHATRGPLRALLWPGFLVQKITTIEPDDAQLEVALGALAVTLGREQAGEKAEATSDRRYPTYGELLSGAAPAS